MWLGLISATVRPPIVGEGLGLREEGHCALCLWLHFDQFSSMYLSAHCWNVGSVEVTATALASSRAARFVSTISTPSRTCWRAATDLNRASLRETSCSEPRPCQRSLPLNQ